MMKDHRDLQEEYSSELSPGYRQDVRKEEGHKFPVVALAVTILTLVVLAVLAFLMI